MQDALQRFVGAMADYRETHTLGDDESALLQNACTTMTDTLCPYIADCLSRIFQPSSPLLDVQAITAALKDKESSAGRLNTEQGTGLESTA